MDNKEKTYAEKRQEAIAGLLMHRQDLVSLNGKNANGLREVYEQVVEGIESTLKKEEESVLLAEKATDKKDELTGDKIFVEVMRERLGITSHRNEMSHHERKRSSSIVEWGEKKLTQTKNFAINYLKDGLRSVRSSIGFRQGYEAAVNCGSQLEEVLKEIQEIPLLDANLFFKALKSDRFGKALASLEKLASSLEKYAPKMARENIASAARSNVRNLIEQHRNEKNGKLEYFGSLEGRIISYVIYLNAAKTEWEKDEADLDYLSFLESKSDEKLASFANKSHDIIKENLETLADNGIISQDDLTYTLAHLKKTYDKKDHGEKKEDSLEDVRLRALILEEDFKIPLGQSIATAKMIKDDDVSRVYEEISRGVGVQAARLLIQNNPNLLMLDNGNLSRYVSSLKALIKDAKKYAGAGPTGISKFLLEQNPAGFSSFEGMYETQKTLNDLENDLEDKINLKEGGLGWKILISTKAIERSEKDNFVANSKEKYSRMIDTLSKNPLRRSRVERIGEFNVFPAAWSGRKSPRIAFHLDQQQRILYIDDFLYHISQYTYVDSWNSRANDKIKVDYYSSRGYVDFKKFTK